MIIYGFLALLVAAAIVGLLIFVLPDDTLAPAVRDTVPTGLPPRSDIGADDVNRLRLPVALRGYRMVDTDAVLDRLGAEIERRDLEIARLRLGLDAGSTPHDQPVTDGAEPAPSPAPDPGLDRAAGEPRTAVVP